ncbi:MAG TPA: DUF4097 family beta strand repeat-containing protein [Actinocatenispora sp.]
MQSFTTTAPITTTIDIPAGRVQLIAADRADTTVEVRPADPGKNRDVTLAQETTVEYADGVLRIQAPTRKNHILGPSGAVEVTVQLPADSRVEATTASADFRVVGRLGDLTYTSAHGPIKIDEAAQVHITSQASDITLGRVTGDAEVSTAKGDITITEAVGGTVTLRADAGNLTVGAAAGVSATLDAGTRYGRIRNTLANTGDTQLDIHATTSYGDITARSL